ncbi:hypothetical protein DENSPDRAFT_499881 [Dentipellis sp. KUC8613]|nr:hypothetical protein DENSPDRAFT_499881 [Dentipellis sp. KUC8613]
MQLAVQKPAVAVGALYAFLSPQRLFGRPRQVLARLPKHLLEQSLKATWHIMSSSTPTFTVLRLALGLTDADVNTINGGNFTLLADHDHTRSARRPHHKLPREHPECTRGPPDRRPRPDHGLRDLVQRLGLRRARAQRRSDRLEAVRQ